MSDVVALLMDSSNASHKHMGKEDKIFALVTSASKGKWCGKLVWFPWKIFFVCEISDTLSLQAINASKTMIKELVKV